MIVWRRAIEGGEGGREGGREMWRNASHGVCVFLADYLNE